MLPSIISLPLINLNSYTRYSKPCVSLSPLNFFSPKTDSCSLSVLDLELAIFMENSPNYANLWEKLYMYLQCIYHFIYFTWFSDVNEASLLYMYSSISLKWVLFFFRLICLSYSLGMGVCLHACMCNTCRPGGCTCGNQKQASELIVMLMNLDPMWQSKCS